MAELAWFWADKTEDGTLTTLAEVSDDGELMGGMDETSSAKLIAGVLQFAGARQALWIGSRGHRNSKHRKDGSSPPLSPLSSIFLKAAGELAEANAFYDAKPGHARFGKGKAATDAKSAEVLSIAREI
jgi:hypothetical protein